MSKNSGPAPAKTESHRAETLSLWPAVSLISSPLSETMLTSRGDGRRGPSNKRCHPTDRTRALTVDPIQRATFKPLMVTDALQQAVDQSRHAGRLSSAQRVALGRIRKNSAPRQGRHKDVCHASPTNFNTRAILFSMSHTHASVLVHCVFSTKQRADLIPDPAALGCHLSRLRRSGV